MNSRQSVRAAFVMAALAVAAFGATKASADGFGWVGSDLRIGWGHGFFHGPRFGWGVSGLGYGHPYYGGCVLKRFVDTDGDIVVRRVCV